MIDRVWQDLRYTVRSLTKAPLFTLAAIATLALGIGANAALFSVADATALRPPDVPNPGELVRVFTSTKDCRSASFPTPTIRSSAARPGRCPDSSPTSPRTSRSPGRATPRRPISVGGWSARTSSRCSASSRRLAAASGRRRRHALAGGGDQSPALGA